MKDLKCKRFLSLLLSIAMVLSLVLIPTASVRADSDEEPIFMHIRIRDMSIDQSVKDQECYLYRCEGYSWASEPEYPNYRGMAFDKNTGTLTLKNVNAAEVGLYLHGNYSGTSILTIVAEGSNRLAYIFGDGVSKIVVKGSGTLSLNAPYTGTVYPDQSNPSEKKTLNNGYINGYALVISGAYGAVAGAVPKLVIGDQTTLKLYGDKNWFSEYDTPYCASFSFEGRVENPKSTVIQHNGVVTPAINWDLGQFPKQSSFYDEDRDYYAEADIPFDLVCVPDGTPSVSGNDLIDALYYRDGGPYASYKYKIEKTGNRLYVNGSDALGNVRQLSADEIEELNANGFVTSDGKLKAFTGSMSNAFHFTKGGVEYHVVRANGMYRDDEFYDQLFEKDESGLYPYLIAGVTKETDRIFHVNCRVVKDSAGKPATDDNLEEILKQEGYVYAGGYNYSAAIRNMEITFSPVSCGTPSSGGSGSSVQPGGSTQPKAPEKGQEETVDGDKYQVTSTGTNPEVEYKGTENSKEKNVTIDGTVKIGGTDCAVTSIGKKSFAGNTSMQQLTIPATVEEIKEGACTGCKNLKKLTIKGKGLKKIGKNAFSKCAKLTSASLPDSVTEIGKGAFDGDKKLGKVTVNGNNLKKVGKNALRGIKKNATITIKAKNKGQYNKVVKMIKKAGNKKLKFKFKKYKK